MDAIDELSGVSGMIHIKKLRISTSAENRGGTHWPSRKSSVKKEGATKKVHQFGCPGLYWNEEAER
jgi:hypothetical protein